ncbi:MAG: acyltransferase family protein [Polyangiales bacterium]
MRPFARLSRDSSVALDMVRGLAALAVAIGHVRSLSLRDYPTLAHPNAAQMVLYLFTGFGHQAVVVFFALSGFLVGGSAMRSIERGDWSFGRYAADRLSRLWAPLIPALVLGLALDRFGLWHWHATGLYGGSAAFGNVVTPGVAGRLGVSTFLLDAVFLQTVLAPTLGTNGALWSLANEATYYALFGLAIEVVLRGRPARTRVLAMLVFVGIATLVGTLGPGILGMGVYWLAGLVVGWVRIPEALRRRWLAWAGVAVFVGVHVVTRAARIDLGDLGTCATFLCALVPLVHVGGERVRPQGLYARSARALSNVSYSLYVTHLPIACLFVAATHPAGRDAPDALGVSKLAACLALVLASVTAAWWVFERNTDWLRDRLRVWFMAPPARRDVG